MRKLLLLLTLGLMLFGTFGCHLLAHRGHHGHHAAIRRATLNHPPVVTVHNWEPAPLVYHHGTHYHGHRSCSVVH